MSRAERLIAERDAELLRLRAKYAELLDAFRRAAAVRGRLLEERKRLLASPDRCPRCQLRDDDLAAARDLIDLLSAECASAKSAERGRDAEN